MQQFDQKKNFSNQVSAKELLYDKINKTQFEFFLKLSGLLSKGIDLKQRYGPIKKDKSLIRIRRIYCQLICSLMWFNTLRLFVLMFISDKWIQLILGDITGYWNDYRLYYLMPSFFLSFQCALCCTIFLMKEKDLSWVVPFFSIRQLQVYNSKVSLDHKMHNSRIRIVIFFVWIITLATTSVIGFITFDTAWESLDQTTFRLWIPWMVFQIIWFFYLVLISYITVSYFNLVCLMISNRFNTVCNEIETLADSNPGPPGSKNDQINQLYFDHNEVCELVDESNSFWQNYIFCTFMTYIPCACYVLYNIFFADFDIILAVYTWGVFFHTLFILAIICISAADVSSEAHAPYTALHTLSLLELPIDLEVNMSTFLHRVRGPTIGYSCLDLFVVTNSSISNTIAAVASYFLIVADFSRSTMTNRYKTQQPDNSTSTMTTLSSMFTMTTSVK
uniref:Gustatory receptor-like protein n=1 Tax=Polyphagotarsonemus latus TaxID=1204166 RepID=A0AAN0LJ39_9ACAR